MRSNPVPGGQHTAYVPTYRRVLRQPWIASPHIINYVSQVRRRLRKDGAPGRRTTGRASPAPAQCAGRAGLKPAPTFPLQPTSKPNVLIPSVEGCRPQAAGWFPAPCATYPRNPRPTQRL
ncbi:MAG: hypothetical protein LBM98_03585 [Oscillospiraceae bacterium]|nr:hypothetical protein [Oscillospiraceae bacterium]